MLGCYDFCGHYEWSFGWIERAGGPAFLREYWREAISRDSQRHARALIASGGFEGMAKYWGHTLAEESPDLEFASTEKPGVYRIDMYDCPSKGFLLRNGLENYHDYCDHCMGWIGPVMKDFGYAVDHEHNHRGQCWWEMRKPDPARKVAAPGETSGKRDVRFSENWSPPGAQFDRYVQATDPDAKQKE